MYGLPFLETIADTPVRDPLRREMAAALAVIHVADLMLQFGCVDRELVRLTRQQVARVPSLHFKSRLREVLDLMLPDAQRDADWRNLVGARLMAYGHELHGRGFFAPAVGVFSLVSDRFFDDVQMRMQAIRWRAFALRLMSKPGDAELCYRELQRVAEASGDRHMVFRARLGLARMAIDRGAMPRAIPMIDAILADAIAAGDVAIQGEALIDRAYIAGTRGSPSAVIRFSLRALQVLPAGPERDRCRVNIARAYRARGNRDGARQIALRVRQLGVNPDERGLAAVLLFDLAIDTGDRLQQDECVAWFAANRGCPHIDATFYETLARACRASGDDEAALDALRHMLEIAEDNKMAKHIIVAEATMRDIQEHRTPARRTPMRDARERLETIGANETAARDVPALASAVTVATRRGGV